MVDAPTTDPRTRAAALRALGLASAPDGTRYLAQVWRDMNVTVLPDWVRELMSSTL